MSTQTVITGASSGLGEALAERLARHGHEVWLCARRKERLEALQARIEAQDGKAHVVQLDVSEHHRVVEVMRDIDQRCGGVDRVIANAGIGGQTGGNELLKANFDNLKPLLDINFTGAIATLAALLPEMRERGRGHLVGVSSIAADIPLPKGGTYGATKAGLTFWLECAALELQAANIDVTIVHPGFVKTPLTADQQFPMPFLMELEDAVEIMARGILNRAPMVRFPAQLGLAARAGNALPRFVQKWLLPRLAGG